VLFGACGVKSVEDTCDELPSRLVSDDIVDMVNASLQTMHLVLITLKIIEWPEHVSDYYAIKLHPLNESAFYSVLIYFMHLIQAWNTDTLQTN
jgi:hypothetical protein